MESTHVKTTKLNLSSLETTSGEEGRIAIFASGNGTNAENIAKHFQSRSAKVVLIVTDNHKAGVIKRAERLGIECLIVRREEITQEEGFVKELQNALLHSSYLQATSGVLAILFLKPFPTAFLIFTQHYFLSLEVRECTAIEYTKLYWRRRRSIVE